MLIGNPHGTYNPKWDLLIILLLLAYCALIKSIDQYGSKYSWARWQPWCNCVWYCTLSKVQKCTYATDYRWAIVREGLAQVPFHSQWPPHVRRELVPFTLQTKRLNQKWCYNERRISWDCLFTSIIQPAGVLNWIYQTLIIVDLIKESSWITWYTYETFVDKHTSAYLQFANKRPSQSPNRGSEKSLVQKGALGVPQNPTAHLALKKKWWILVFRYLLPPLWFLRHYNKADQEDFD